MKELQFIIKFFPIHSFIISLVFVIALFYSCKGKIRLFFLMSISLIYVYISGSHQGLILMVSSSIAVYVIARRLQSNKSIFLLSVGVVFSLSIMIVFKSSSSQYIESLRPIGYSYFVFKYIHYLVDNYRGRLKHSDIWIFLAFIYFFPTLKAGPINRYEKFADGLKEKTLKSNIDKSGIEKGVSRVIIGLFKKYVVADRLLLISNIIVPNVYSAGRVGLITNLVLLALVIYYDFSGYTDLAIGLGKLLGFSLPENFNSPYTRGNIRDFWANWHMTLTSWLREYLFLPLVKVLGKPLKGYPLMLNALCQLVLMSSVGLWHGFSISFFVWGLYHGILLSLHKSYEEIMYKLLPKGTLKSLRANYIYKALAWVATFGCVSLGMAFFYYDFSTATYIIRVVIGL